MPIPVECPDCGKILHVPDDRAGKRGRCPACKAVLQVPDKTGAAAHPGARAKVRAVDRWYVKTSQGEQYGPTSRGQLDRWVAEGRITADSQVLQEGAEQWQWARDVFPLLAAQTASAENLNASVQVDSASTNVATDPDRAAPHRSVFRPRQYPAMRVVRAWYSFCGWVIIIIGVLGAIFIVLQAFGAAMLIAAGDSLSADAVAGVVAVTVFLLVIWVFWIVLCAISCWFLAEAIKVALDIQDNTHRAVHYLRELHSEKH